MEQLIELGYPDKTAYISTSCDENTKCQITKWIEALLPESCGITTPGTPEDLRMHWTKLLKMMTGEVKDDMVDWDQFLSISVQYLREAKVYAARFRAEHIKHIYEHSNSVHKDNLGEIKRKLKSMDTCAPEISRSDPFNQERAVDAEVAHQKGLSKTLSEIEAENTVLERSIAVRRDELERANVRLKTMRPLKTQPVAPKISPEQQEKLKKLFTEYSAIQRNISFVEHHLYRVKNTNSSNYL